MSSIGEQLAKFDPQQFPLFPRIFKPKRSDHQPPRTHPPERFAIKTRFLKISLKCRKRVSAREFQSFSRRIFPPTRQTIAQFSKIRHVACSPVASAVCALPLWQWMAGVSVLKTTAPSDTFLRTGEPQGLTGFRCATQHSVLTGLRLLPELR